MDPRPLVRSESLGPLDDARVLGLLARDTIEVSKILNVSQAPVRSSIGGPYLVSWLKKPGTCRYTDAYLCLAQTVT